MSVFQGITELVGEAGCGKTQLAMQILLRVTQLLKLASACHFSLW